MTNSVTGQILSALDEIEARERVRILYACESGSRAWGFESADSDYDVRFLYLRAREWYLSIDVELRPEVIEIPVEESLDINGWDLRKALHLLRKSNPPLLEWLGSPIVYREIPSVAERLRGLRSAYYSPRACMYHYVSMARGNYKEFLQGPDVIRKKYLYVLRPILAALWIEKDLGVVPTEFQKLVDRLVGPGSFRDSIAELLGAKRAGCELGLGSQLPAINAFIERELARLEQEKAGYVLPRRPIEELNELFRATLDEVWQ
jgi:predicted nucleotidyltransferase